MIKKIYKNLISEQKRLNIRKQCQRIIAPLYYGDNFYCNCCNRKFRKFLPKGNITRLNSQCPYCLSLERTRVLEWYLDKELNVYNSKNKKILHFAPEFALFRKISKIKDVFYVDADINPSYARNIIDITNIPFSENFFDYIICSHVLGHVPDEPKAIQELYRVLNSDGIALIFTLLSDSDNTLEDLNIKTPAEKLKIYGEMDLCRLHGNDFATRLKAPGFIVEEIDYRLCFPVEIQKRYSLGNGKREKIFKCTKLPI